MVFAKITIHFALNPCPPQTGMREMDVGRRKRSYLISIMNSLCSYVKLTGKLLLEVACLLEVEVRER